MGHNRLPEKKKAQASAYQEELIELLCCYSGKPMGILEGRSQYKSRKRVS